MFKEDPERSAFRVLNSNSTKGAFRKRSLPLIVLCAIFILTAISVHAVTITPATSPTAVDNDYTRINNAVQTATPGTTIELSGTFDWTEPNAAASWALGSDGLTGGANSDDDYCILAPAGLNNVTITAASLGAGRIEGPGDLPGANLEGVFQFFSGGTNQNWTISNIEFVDFDNPIGFYFNGGPTNLYNNTTITNNYILVARDLNATVAPVDTNQNIGIHFAFGTNQTISNNVIEFHGDGISDSANARFSTEVGMQSNTSGGAVYDGLLISGNTLRVLNAQSADPEVILGIWENSHGHSSNITVSNNTFSNLAPGNNPALNLQRAFRVTSHSSATTTVAYSGNNVSGANIGYQWLAGSNFAPHQPVVMTGNTLTGNGIGILVQSNGSATMTFNRIAGNVTSGVENASTGAVTAENNWWGCNFGPGSGGAGCAGTANAVVGTVDSSPWLTLTTSAAPNAIQTGGNSAISSALTINSDAVNTSGSGNLPDGTPVTFGGTLGTVAPPTAVTNLGTASTTYTAGIAAGSGAASTTVDGQTVSAPITITFSCNNVVIPTGIETLRNSQVTVPITVDDTTGRGIIAFDYTVTYNPGVITYLGTSQTGTLSNGMTITVNSITPGTLIVSGFGVAPLTGAGTLIEMNFFATGTVASTTPVNFSGFVFNEGVPCITTSNGSVNIISGEISGVVTYANALTTTPVPYTTLSGVGSVPVAGQTDLTGAYSLDGFGAGPYTVTPTKTTDVNGITSFDSARIAQHVTALISLNSTQLMAADVSGNTTVTSFDAALIAQYVVSIPNASSTGTWKFLPASRSYANVETNSNNQDYSAILMGEVSGNWAPPTSFAPIAKNDSEFVPAVVSVTAPTVNVGPGANVPVNITVPDTSGQGIISYQYDVAYNPAVVTPDAVPCDLSGTLSAAMLAVCNPVSPGLLKIAVFGSTPLTGAGILMKVRFNVIGPGGSSSPVNIQSFLFNEDPLLLGTVTNGLINVFVPTASDVEVAGTVLDTRGSFVRAATVVLTDSSGATRQVRTSSFGRFTFTGIRAGETYTLSVNAKGMRFQPQVLVVDDSMTDLSVVAQE